MQGAMNRSATVQAVLKQLRRDIIMKNLKNDTAVTELQFSQDYGCSRAALRGALTVLEQEGLIRVMPNGTKRISTWSEDDINNLYGLRAYVECSAVKQILEKTTPDISKLMKVLEDASDTDFLECDTLFHETLVAMSENKALLQVWRTFVPVIRELFMLNFTHSQTLKDTIQERHMLIVKMLVNKDERVTEILNSHIEEARRLSIQ